MRKILLIIGIVGTSFLFFSTDALAIINTYSPLGGSISASFNSSTSILTISGDIYGGLLETGVDCRADNLQEIVYDIPDFPTYFVNNGGPSGSTYLTVKSTGQNAACNDFQSPPYVLWEYTLDPAAPQNNINMAGFAPGDYTVTITFSDSSGFQGSTVTRTASFTIPPPPPPSTCQDPAATNYGGALPCTYAPGAFSITSVNWSCNANNASATINWSTSANVSYYNVYVSAWYTGYSWALLGQVGSNVNSYSYFERKATETSYKVIAFNNYGNYDSGPAYGGYCPVASVSLSASPNPVAYNTSSTVSYSSTNAWVCTASWGSVTPNTSGTYNTGNLTSAQTYSLTCSDPDGGYADSKSVTVNVNAPPVPTASINCNGSSSCTIGYNSAATINWSSTTTTSCSVSPTGWSGTSGSKSTGPLTSNQTYTVSCSGPGGSASASTSVTITGPSVDIKANSSNGPIELAWGSDVNLSWTSSNAGSCSATGSWSGSKVVNGSQDLGSQTIPGTYTYTLSCSGNGTASDSVQVTIDPPIPTASNAIETDPNYCVSGPGGTISWSYSDPAGSPQSAYEVQVTNTGNFNNPMYDSGKINFSSTAFTIPNGILAFNTTYKARVRVWNSYDVVSAWSNATSSWKTPPYAYPQVDFNWTANGILNNTSPPLNKPIQFTDATTFNGNPNGREWGWLFGDGGSAATQNPSHTYVAEGSYYVTLTATDNANQTCSRTKGPLIIQKPIPQWREVAPR